MRSPSFTQEVEVTEQTLEAALDVTPVVDQVLETGVYEALDAYDSAQKALAEAQSKALGSARDHGVRIPKVNEIVEYHIEGPDASPLGLPAQVLFVHSATVITLVASKHEGGRHTHSNVRFGTGAGQWGWRN
jgi:hypothetical protein